MKSVGVLSGFGAASPYLLGMTFKVEHQQLYTSHSQQIQLHEHKPIRPVQKNDVRVQVSGGSDSGSLEGPWAAGLIVVVVHRKAAMEVEKQTWVWKQPWLRKALLNLAKVPSRLGLGTAL